ncbi:MAG: universal stress protein [Candidatus Limnocylindrales bacterium]
MFRTILLATDLTASSAIATDRAIELAARLQARLLIINVMDHRRLDGLGTHDRVDQARGERENALLRIVREARTVGAQAEFIVWEGEPAPALRAAVIAEQADLLVVGSHGRDRAGRMLLGSVSDDMVRTAACPVLIVRS